MKHFTHKSWLKWIGGTIAALSVVIGLSFSSAVAAQPLQEPDLSLAPNIQKAVSCFAFGAAHGLSNEKLKIFLSRIGKASMHAGAVYQLGYTRGLLDAYGYANASKFDSIEAARYDAAKTLYKLTSCTVNESI